MLRIDCTQVYGWEAAIRGMRNPKNSWSASDSVYELYYECIPFQFGENDLKLAKTLANAGNDHGKFLRMITVTMDITAPLYWWKEFDTYKVGTVADSCSTMHKIQSKKFVRSDFSTDHLLDMKSVANQSPVTVLDNTIEALNFWRDMFNSSEADRVVYAKSFGYNTAPTKKDCWWQMIQLLPSSYNQRRTIQLNYAVLRNQYAARKNHKLDEWHTYCDWIRTLPYAKELILNEGEPDGIQ